MSGRVVVFQCEASPKVGGGHVSRCLAIADALQDSGWTCCFWTTRETPWTFPGIRKHHIEQRAGDEVPPHCDLLVVDDYETDIASECRWRERAGRIVVIDDLANRTHDCDVLIDTGPGRTPSDYASLLPRSAVTALGPRYSPTRREFLARRSSSLATRSEGLQDQPMISICLGATDPHGLSSRAARIAAERLPGWRVEAVIPADQRGELPSGILDRQPGFSAMVHCSDMPALLAASVMTIGAGGIGTWERCVLGVPCAVITTADNQMLNIEGALRAGACVSLGDWRSADDVRWGDVIEAVACNHSTLRQMSTAASSLCDGLGSERIAAILSRQFAASVHERIPAEACASRCVGGDDGLWVRSATPGDCGEMFRWQLEPGARAHFRNPNPPGWDEHRKWFEDSLHRTDRWIGIVSVGSVNSGMVRLDWHPTDGWFEISILISHAFRGRGVGRAVLARLRKQLADMTLLANVSPANNQSQRAFQAAGFTAISPDILIARAQP